MKEHNLSLLKTHNLKFHNINNFFYIRSRTYVLHLLKSKDSQIEINNEHLSC